MPRTILVIEDDPDIRCVVTDTLEYSGFQTVAADCGSSGLTAAREVKPNLVVLDLGLPDFDGSEVIRRLRNDHNDVPVIVLTAMDAADRKFQLLNDGADDYLTKPFNPEELIARVHEQFRKHEGSGGISVGPLQLHPAEQRVTWNGEIIPLTPLEFEVLRVLARQPGRVVSSELLKQEVWGNDDSISEQTVSALLANLRAKFRALGANRVMRVVRGVGYGLNFTST